MSFTGNAARRMSLCEMDVMLCARELAHGADLKMEMFDGDEYLNLLIDKPWGHEYRVYADSLYDIWMLSLNPGHATSLHCHPRKETALLCLAGTLRLQMLNQSLTLSEGESVMIERGVFHSTSNVGSVAASLVEVETPRNKFDLVRVKDGYGRSGQRYETGFTPCEDISIQDIAYMRRAKLRRHDASKRFGFDVRTGAEIHASPGRRWFAVSLSVQDALGREISVYDARAIRAKALEPARYYLLIDEIVSTPWP